MNLPDHFSLAKEHPNSFEIHDHRDDSRFHVAKAELHPANQIKVMKMRKFSEGGEEPDDDVTPPSAEPEVAAPEAPESIAPVPDQTAGLVPQFAPPPTAPQGTPSLMAPQGPPGATLSQAPGEMPIAAKGVPGNPYAGIPGMEEQAKAIQAAGGAQQTMGKEQGQALQDFQRSVNEHQKIYNGQLGEINKEQAVYQKQLIDNKIDPRRYYNNMGTGQKISTAIALLLGGVGAGLTRGPNLALQMMDKAVDHDIEAQKMDLGKTHSLLNLNMQKYHNLQTAEAATRLQYNTTLQTQLQMAQAKATNGLAAAAIHSQLGKLQQQAGVYKQQMALQGVKAQSLGAFSPTGEGGIPVGQEPPALLLDPKYRESRVEINGKAYQANDKEAAGKVRDVETLAAPALDLVQKLKELSNDPSTRFAGSPSNLQAHGIMGDLAVKLPLLSGATIGAKRVNSEEIKHQLERIQDPTRFDQAMGGVKNDQFFQSLEKEVEGMRANHLVGYKGMNAVKSFTPAIGALPKNK